jgi:phthalate 4,5-dioxygenase oxygenase subunit
MPFHQIRWSTTERGLPSDAGHIWVPIDDETCMVYNWCFSKSAALDETDRLEQGLGNGPIHVDQQNFRSKARLDNNYFIDRQVQKTESYTGIDGINVQDRAIQESMGKIVNRLGEHLGPADKAIVYMRRLLLQAVKTVADGGAPPGVAPSYYTLTTGLDVLPKDADWRAALAPDLTADKILQTV